MVRFIIKEIFRNRFKFKSIYIPIWLDLLSTALTYCKRDFEIYIPIWLDLLLS